MEEDIKILKEFLDKYKLIDTNTLKEIKPTQFWGGATYVESHEFQAMYNILNRLEQDERVIEEMAKHISNFDIDEPICNKKTGDCYADMYGVCEDCIIDHFRKKCE